MIGVLYFIFISFHLVSCSVLYHKFSVGNNRFPSLVSTCSANIDKIIPGQPGSERFSFYNQQLHNNLLKLIDLLYFLSLLVFCKVSLISRLVYRITEKKNRLSSPTRTYSANIGKRISSQIESAVQLLQSTKTTLQYASLLLV